MERSLKPELLDHLAADDPQARQSRRDLRRLNVIMGHVRMMASALAEACRNHPKGRIVEWGAGDGTFLLKVVQRIGLPPATNQIVFIDRQSLISPETRQSFREMNCQVDARAADIFEWAHGGGIEPGDIIVTNLFLHHFAAEQLSALFLEASRSAQVLVALEPRRAPLPLAFSRLLWLIGCNRVTRHDASVSVRAGFNRAELSGLWPGNSPWTLR